MKILFLHGWQSTPGGVKPTFLKDHGQEVLNPALPDDDFGAAVKIAQAEFDRHRPDVVVGSSRGGAVAMNIKVGAAPLVLLCPAWKSWGSAKAIKPGTIILHSKADDTVPFADSQELLRNSGLPESALIVVGTDHRLAETEPLAKMLEAVERAATRRQVKKIRAKRPLVTLKGLGCALGALLILPAIDLIGILIAQLIPLRYAGGIEVTIQNTGRQPIRSVIVEVTGAKYSLGDIAVGTSAKATVKATGASNLQIEFTDMKGNVNRLDAGGNLEPDCRGTIQVSIKEGGIEKNDQNIGRR